MTAIGLYQLQRLLGLRESVAEAAMKPHLERVADEFLTRYLIAQA